MRQFVFILMLVPGIVFADIQVKSGKVTARLNSESLQQVMEQFRQQTDIKLYVDQTIMGQSVSAEFQDLTVAAAVKKILEGTGINFVVLGGGDGNADRIFIGTNKPPGAPPRKLDNRPPGAPSGRGVVTPVNPPPQQVPPQNVQPEPQQRRPAPSPVEIPTGGGYVPNTPQQPPPNAEENQENQQEDEEQ